MIHVALLGLAAGDVLGAGVEGADPATASRMLPSLPMPGTRWTDDTQQALVVARHLLVRGRVDGVALGAELRAPGLPHRGIGPGFARFLESGAPQPSAGNGAAMRSAPIGIRSPLPGLVEEAIAAGLVTHADPRGVAAGVAVAAAVRLAGAGLDGVDLLVETADAVTDAEHRLFADHGLRFAAGDRWHTMSEAIRAAVGELGATAEAMAESVGRRAAETADLRLASGTHPYAPASVVSALVLAAAASEPEEAVRAAVRLGGDTDTVAGMVGAIVGVRFGVDRWAWPVPKDDLLLEIGRRLAAGEGASGIPDVSELIS
ncbi:MAG TPA: ADP-ribosylglycohydrolase family protein [Acidimicrobiia bacterium]|nr:ADP-ribosylglycohydrolase family protein [Acidimicrobiia bacterium]